MEHVREAAAEAARTAAEASALMFQEVFTGWSPCSAIEHTQQQVTRSSTSQDSLLDPSSYKASPLNMTNGCKHGSDCGRALKSSMAAVLMHPLSSKQTSRTPDVGNSSPYKKGGKNEGELVASAISMDCEKAMSNLKNQCREMNATPVAAGLAFAPGSIISSSDLVLIAGHNGSDLVGRVASDLKPQQQHQEQQCKQQQSSVDLICSVSDNDRKIPIILSPSTGENGNLPNNAGLDQERAKEGWKTGLL